MIKNNKIRSIMLATGFAILDGMIIKTLLDVADWGLTVYSHYNNIHINTQLIDISKICITVVCCVILFIRRLKKYLARTEAEW